MFEGDGSLEDCRVKLVDRLIFDGDGFLDDFLRKLQERPSCGGECSSALCILLEVVMLQLVVLLSTFGDRA